MTILTRFLLACAMIGAATAPQAQQISGNELLETCTSDNSVMAGFCIGYIIGYSEGAPWGATLAIIRATEAGDTDSLNEMASLVTGSCVPSEASNEQLRDVVVKHLQSNPETRHTSARTLIWTAYSEAFPCE